MDSFKLFRKKAVPSQLLNSHSALDDISTEKRTKLLKLTQATRHLEILRNSVDILRKTTYPEIFFSRYYFAIKEAKVVIRLCNGDDSGNSAENILEDLTSNKIQIFNEFLDRCDHDGKLPFIKREIEDHRPEMPLESYSHFLKLLNRQINESDTDVYIFCSVAFYEGGKSYYYLSNNPQLRCGDRVIVPVGKTNTEKTGHIVKVETFKGCDAPVPVNKLKYIIDAENM